MRIDVIAVSLYAFCSFIQTPFCWIISYTPICASHVHVHQGHVLCVDVCSRDIAQVVLCLDARFRDGVCSGAGSCSTRETHRRQQQAGASLLSRQYSIRDFTGRHWHCG